MIQELKNTTKLVFEILQLIPETRENDNLLYYYVCKKRLKRDDVKIDEITFEHALLLRDYYGFPSFETVRRTRQKVQAEHPELKGKEETQAFRAALEPEFRAYAKSVGGVWD